MSLFGLFEKKPDSHVSEDPLTSGSFRRSGAPEPGEPGTHPKVFGEENRFEIQVEELVLKYLDNKKLSAANVFADPVMIREIAKELGSTSKGMGIVYEDVSQALFNIAKKKNSKAA